MALRKFSIFWAQSFHFWGWHFHLWSAEFWKVCHMPILEVSVVLVHTCLNLEFAPVTWQYLPYRARTVISSIYSHTIISVIVSGWDHLHTLVTPAVVTIWVDSEWAEDTYGVQSLMEWMSSWNCLHEKPVLGLSGMHWSCNRKLRHRSSISLSMLFRSICTSSTTNQVLWLLINVKMVSSCIEIYHAKLINMKLWVVPLITITAIVVNNKTFFLLLW